MLLEVKYINSKQGYYVINPFDGVISGKFCKRSDAEDFAYSKNANTSRMILNTIEIDFKKQRNAS